MTPEVGVGMPHLLRLEAFGVRVGDAYGHLPYLVGSAAKGKTFRDVDVRLILPDEEFERRFGPVGTPARLFPLWALVCDALSELARVQTGLPVDFQVQSLSHANLLYVSEPRVPLGMRLAT